MYKFTESIRDLPTSISPNFAQGIGLFIAIALVQIAQIVAIQDLSSLAPGAKNAGIVASFVVLFLTTLGLIGFVRMLDHSSGSRRLATAQFSKEGLGDLISDGLLFTDTNHIIYANQLARKIMGKARHIAKLADLTGEFRSALDQAAATTSHIPFEVIIDGERRHFVVLCMDSRLHESTSHRHAFVLQDVTFRHENEEAKLNFIGTLSHEIKTPITSLTMALAMLERVGFDAELVRIANSDVSRLRKLIEELLNVSNLSSPKTTPLAQHEKRGAV